MTARAFICGCAGLELSADDRAFIRDADPWGFILFRRNIDSPAQVTRLTASFRDITGRADAPVLVDQEGGRVQRLGPPHWRKYPAGAAYRRLSNDPGAQRGLARLASRLMAHDLLQLGITVDCLPVLDVPAPGGHSVIGDRAYADDAAQVATLGRAAAEGLIAGGVLPVMKHVPGHGRAGADSHLELPVVTVERAALEAADFLPFRILADLPMAMTAHVVYTAIDPKNPATTSRKVMREIVRGHIGYDGLVMTDDLSMKALSGSFGDKTRSAFRAGADVALHCNGDISEAEQVAEAAPLLRGAALRRATAALARIRHLPEPLDAAEAHARLNAAMATLA
jgi:beta-N-acetylhexosaminidase